MSKHTPGPWYIGDEYCKSMDEIASASSGGRTVAVVWTRRASEFATARQQFKPDAEMTANARLIAAAPDLLDALDNCVTNINATAIAQNDVSYIIRRFKAINEIARAAIAKATGE